MSKFNLTNEKDFSIFVGECNYWINKFGITDWEVSFTHEDDDSDTRGSILFTYPNRIARITLSKDWGSMELNNYTVCKCAFHEVCELMMGEIQCMMENRFVTREQLNSAIHGMIRRMENVVFDDEYNNRKVIKIKSKSKSGSESKNESKNENQNESKAVKIKSVAGKAK